MKSLRFVGLLAIMFLAGCRHSSNAPSSSTLDARCDLLSQYAINCDFANVIRVQVIDTTGTQLVNSRSFYGMMTPESNEAIKIEPSGLFYPLLLSLIDELDTSMKLPAVYSVFGDNAYEVVDTRFVKDTAGHFVDSLSLRQALSVTSNVAFVSLAEECFGQNRNEFLRRVNVLFNDKAILPNSIDSDSSFYLFCQGRGFSVDMETLLQCYRRLLPSSVGALLPEVGDEIRGISTFSISEYRMVSSLFLGVSDDRIGLVNFDRSHTHGQVATNFFMKLMSNQEKN